MSDAPDPATDVWFVYVLESLARSVTYVGIAKDVDARLLQHNGERPGGAKSTRAARPWRVARRLGPFDSRGRAPEGEPPGEVLGRARRRGQGRHAWCAPATVFSRP